MSATIETCTGHVGFFSGEFSGGTWEYCRKADGSLWRAYATKATDYETGYRLGASFVAPAHMAEDAIAKRPELFGTVEQETAEAEEATAEQAAALAAYIDARENHQALLDDLHYGSTLERIEARKQLPAATLAKIEAHNEAHRLGVLQAGRNIFR